MTQGLPEGFSIKSFWQRPEGTVGMVVAVVLGIIAIYGLGLALPFIITLLQNLLTAGLLFVAAAIMITILTSKRWWTLFFGSFKLIMRWVTNIFITIDPIGILENYVDRLRDKLIEIDKQIENLRGQMGQLKVTITRNENERLKAIGIAKAAKEKGRQAALVLNARSAGRLKQSNITLQQLYTKLEALMRMLNKMREVSAFMFEDIKQNVDTMKRQYKAINAAHRAMKAVMTFIRDASDDKSLYDQTTEYLLNDYGQKIGEIDQFMEVATPFIEGVDLQNMAFEEDTLKELESWEKKADNILLGDAKSALISDEELAPLLLEAPKERIPVVVSGPAAIPAKKYLKRT